jgi:polyisoprenoid-binding protein YceI
MSVKAGSYTLTAKDGSLHVYTFKRGLLSWRGNNLLIDVTDFAVNLKVSDFGSTSIDAEMKANSLKVICAMKGGKRQHDTLKSEDISEIENFIDKEVLHPAKYPTIKFCSTDVQKKDEGYRIKGDLTLHGATRAIEFDACMTPDNTLKGSVALLQKDYGIKLFKVLLGMLRLKNEVTLSFEFGALSQSM